jgi:hypothetical protein
MSGLAWRTPVVEEIHDAEVVEKWRLIVEFELLLKYTAAAVSEDDREEATLWADIDLLDSGHTPSQIMRDRLCDHMENKLLWPASTRNKQHRRSAEEDWLFKVRWETDRLALTKYDGRRNPWQRAEEDVAEMFGLSVDVLRRRRARYRVQLAERETTLRRSRARFLK